MIGFILACALGYTTAGFVIAEIIKRVVRRPVPDEAYVAFVVLWPACAVYFGGAALAGLVIALLIRCGIVRNPHRPPEG